MTIIVNTFGGPGCGKSTICAGVFYKLKSLGKNVELVTEVAKDFTWANRNDCLRCQPLIFGKQLYRLERLVDKVDAVITDSPIILSLAYANQYPESFKPFVNDVFNKFNNMNYIIVRKKDYVPIGRRQSEESAKFMDEKIQELLTELHIPAKIVDGNKDGVKEISSDIAQRLNNYSGTSKKSAPAN